VRDKTKNDDITRMHAIQHKTRKSDNKKGDEARRILTLQYEQKIETVAQIDETLD
jgi:hypothetical protein